MNQAFMWTFNIVWGQQGKSYQLQESVADFSEQDELVQMNLKHGLLQVSGKYFNEILL